MHAPRGRDEIRTTVGKEYRKYSLWNVVTLVFELLDVVRAGFEHAVVPFRRRHRYRRPISHGANTRYIAAHSRADRAVVTGRKEAAAALHKIGNGGLLICQKVSGAKSE